MLSGLILINYYVRYPHPVLFWEMKSFFLYYKLQKHMLFRGFRILNALNLEK